MLLLQVRSVLRGDEHLPRGDKKRDSTIREYDNILRALRSVESCHVNVKRVSLPSRTSPDGANNQVQVVTLSNAYGNH